MLNLTEKEPEPSLLETPPNPVVPKPAATGRPIPRNLKRGWAVGILAVLVGLGSLFFLLRARSQEAAPATMAEPAAAPTELTLQPEALSRLEFAEVTRQDWAESLRFTGNIEANQLLTQEITPLVSGRVEQVLVLPGQSVKAGDLLTVISSPEIAEVHAALHDSETRLEIAERNLKRVELAENRVAVLQAQARLEEAEKNLNRTRRLTELEAASQRDVLAAETAYKTAKAEFDFQSNVALNREVQEARALVETAKVEAKHIRDKLKALGAPVPDADHSDHSADTARVEVRSPIAGLVSERLVNPGTGLKPGDKLFTIVDLGKVWVEANVPERFLPHIRLGQPIRAVCQALPGRTFSGTVNFLESHLNETTRTAKVRFDVANPEGVLRAGMFTEVELADTAGQLRTALVVPAAAVHQVGERQLLFVSQPGNPGRFAVREVEIGQTREPLVEIRAGVQVGERVAAKGSLILKSRLLKAEFGAEE
ncbi:MAG: efflux RND transporter periplasmic adaptor subunit [Blastocatellia bacterium]|nr:efflux RND transporter periplasmic adaptor subunit [Blastocatellia bacterium]